MLRRSRRWVSGWARCLVMSGWAWAGDNAETTMAGILLGLRHFPSAAQQATLAEIAADATYSRHLRDIANAIAHLAHHAAADHAALAATTGDAASTAGEKALARAVLDINHRVTDADAGALKALMPASQ